MRTGGALRLLHAAKVDEGSADENNEVLSLTHLAVGASEDRLASAAGPQTDARKENVSCG